MKPASKAALDNQKLRASAEAQLVLGARASVVTAPTLPAAALLHELQVHQIELEMQNETLRQVQAELEESHSRYFNLYEFAPVGYLSITAEGLIEQINLTGVILLGVERKQLLHRSFVSLVSVVDQSRWVEYFRNVTGDEKHINPIEKIELSLQRRDGSVFVAQLAGQPNSRSQSQNRKPGATGLSMAISDISALKRAEEELRIAAIAFDSQNGMFITNDNGEIIRVTPAFTRITGYSAAEAIGQTPAMLSSGLQNPTFYQAMWAALKSTGIWEGELWNKRKDGELFAEWLNITAVVVPELGTTHFVGSFSDITASKAAEAEIQRLAFYDLLTNLPNRRLLYDRLGQALAASSRNGQYGALLFIDLDHFKVLNDTRGHDIGDLLLIEVAHLLRTVMREGDTVARLGGDEFVVLLEDLGATTDEAAALAKKIGDKLHNALLQPFNLNGHDYLCRLSIGVGLYHTTNTVEEMFKRADLALYKAKSSGRNTLRFFDPEMQAALDEKTQLEAELRQALHGKQMRLYYQPQVSNAQRVTGAEALLRWQHPTRGLVAPNAFIPLAEENGLIVAIGIWVLQTACVQIKLWENDAATCELEIAVNVSARQFHQPDFVAQVKSVLAASGANPLRLKLELTESLVLVDVDDAITKMREIKQLGIRFSMDDFGTGYSSLSYLARLPLDQLKIDQSFMHDLPGDSVCETIVKAIITLGNGLALNVIAEGVETQAQRDFLQANGCHVFQGYLYSRPLPLEKFEAFVKQA